MTTKLPNTTQLRWPLLCALCLLSVFAQAELRWYDVEAVVFSHARGEYINAETWPSEWDDIDLTDAIDLSTAKNSLYVKRSSNGPISGIADRIDKSSRYELLTYKRWRQPGLKESRAKPVVISSEKTWSFLKDEGVDEAGNPVSRLTEVPALSGTIQIVLGRFLHINADLLYTAPVNVLEVISAVDTDSPESPINVQKSLAKSVTEETVMQGFHMKASRKTRSKQTQFIDHPMFGLIVRITPVATS